MSHASLSHWRYRSLSRSISRGGTRGWRRPARRCPASTTSAGQKWRSPLAGGCCRRETPPGPPLLRIPAGTRRYCRCGPGLPTPQWTALKYSQGIPNGGAVADHGHRLAGVVTGRSAGWRRRCAPQALEGLAALHPQPGIRGVEPSELLCVGAVDLPQGLSSQTPMRKPPQGLPGDQGRPLGL